MPPPSAVLSAEEARRVALFAQGLLGPRQRGGPATMLRRLGGVQLDTISVLARSHELVTFARCGAMPRPKVDRAYWGSGSETFEYWSHAACLLPLEAWPAYGLARRQRLAKGRRWHRLADQAATCAKVVEQIRAEGPLTAKQLGGAKRGGVWWDWSEVKIAAEWLLDIGELVCRERRGFQRVYELAERAVPPELAGVEWSDEECARVLVGEAGRALGVGNVADLAAYNGVPSKLVRAVVGDTELQPVQVEGWVKPAFVAPEPLDVLERRVNGRSLLLSPFDSLIWFRPRTERLFGFRHRLEAYVPRERRLYGYFAMPILAGTKLVGLVDPGRRGQTLVAKQVTLESRPAARHVAGALREAASWVGCDTIAVERVEPAESRAEIEQHLAQLGYRSPST
ncbi:MAG TPA: crosslink repair DNA glycosylase YcaQ family protein [Acidimicrobiales bacterium]|jgi:hypothetical protein